jgi:hypothetical protein
MKHHRIEICPSGLIDEDCNGNGSALDGEVHGRQCAGRVSQEKVARHVVVALI